jgi:hypothetical protein
VQPPVHWLLGTLCSGVKRQGREANYNPSSSAKVRNEWIHTATGQLCTCTLHQAPTRRFSLGAGTHPEAPCNLFSILTVTRIGSQVSLQHEAVCSCICVLQADTTACYMTHSPSLYKRFNLLDLGLISNLMHKILVYSHTIHLLNSSTCFEH